MKRIFITLLMTCTISICDVIVMPFRNLKTNEPDLVGVELRNYVESLLERSDSKLDPDFLDGVKLSFSDIDPQPSQRIITGSYLHDKGKWYVYIKISNTRNCTGHTHYFEGTSIREVKDKMKEQFLNQDSVKKMVKDRLNDLANGTIENVVRFKEFMLGIPFEKYDWEMYFLLGEACRTLKEFDDANIYYDEAIKLTEDDSQKITVLISVGIMYRHMKQYDEAIKTYDKALKICTDDVQRCVLLNNKGNVLYLMDRKKEALKVWSEALKYANPEMKRTILINIRMCQYETDQNSGN